MKTFFMAALAAVTAVKATWEHPSDYYDMHRPDLYHGYEHHEPAHYGSIADYDLQARHFA